MTYKSAVPPLGARPRFVVEEERLNELKGAIMRFVEANYPIPLEQILEYNELSGKLKVEVPMTEEELAKLERMKKKVERLTEKII